MRLQNIGLPHDPGNIGFMLDAVTDKGGIVKSFEGLNMNKIAEALRNLAGPEGFSVEKYYFEGGDRLDRLADYTKRYGPVIVGVAAHAPGDTPSPHAILVDGVEIVDGQRVVLIRDPGYYTAIGGGLYYERADIFSARWAREGSFYAVLKK